MFLHKCILGHGASHHSLELHLMCAAVRSNVAPDAMLSLNFEFVVGDGSTTVVRWLHPSEGYLRGMDQGGVSPMTGSDSSARALHGARGRRSPYFERLAGLGTTAIVTGPDSEMIVFDTRNPVDGIMFIIGLPVLLPVGRILMAIYPTSAHFQLEVESFCDIVRIGEIDPREVNVRCFGVVIL